MSPADDSGVRVAVPATVCACDCDCCACCVEAGTLAASLRRTRAALLDRDSDVRTLEGWARANAEHASAAWAERDRANARAARLVRRLPWFALGLSVAAVVAYGTLDALGLGRALSLACALAVVQIAVAIGSRGAR